MLPGSNRLVDVGQGECYERVALFNPDKLIKLFQPRFSLTNIFYFHIIFYMQEIETVKNRYHIIKKLGSGAMGEVFLTKDRLFDNKLAAVKVINKNFLNETNITRFKKEFEVMTHLRHPNLIRVFDFGKDSALNNYFIAMQYIEGRPLSDFLSQTPFDREKTFNIIVQLLRALAFIHSRNIIHRDIKPDNVILVN